MTPSARPAETREYDRRYFDKWYRNPRFRVKTARELDRQVAFVLAAAAYALGRPVRSVLDVGCGEANWRAPILRRGPNIHYAGVDSSDYAVARYGARRNIRKGTIDALDAVGLRERYDLVLCVGMLNYLTPSELRAGLAQIRRRACGLVYLELFTSADEGVFGDTRGGRFQSPAWYRARIRAAGFVPCGMHCYIPDRLREHLCVMETCDA